MANAIAKVLADYCLSWIKGTAFPASNATLYVALLTALPTKNDGTGLAEVSGSSYARQAVADTAWSAIATAADNLHDQIDNTAAITFPTVTTTGYTVVGLAIYDALAAGNLLSYGAVTSQAVAVGNQYSLPAAALLWEF